MTPHEIDGLAVSALAYLADVAIRTSAFAALIAALALALRRSPAAMRLAVWRLVLIVALAMPLLGRVLPALTIEMPVVASAIAERPTVSGAPAGAAGAADAHGAFPFAAASVTGSVVTWPVFFVVVYLAGVAVLLARLATGTRVARRFLRRTRPIADERVRERVGLLSSRIGLRAVPDVGASNAALVPMTLAVWRPAIVLPGDWPQWSAARLEAVLLHELSHIARRDPLTQRLSLVYRAATWFNPLSWWLHRRLLELGEHASDEAVLAGGVGATDYAETLVGFFAALRERPERATWHVAMASGTGTSAVRRVERVLSWSGTTATRAGRLTVLAMLAVTVPAALVAAAVQPARSQEIPAVASLPALPVPASPAAAPALPASPALPVASVPKAAPQPDVRPAPAAPAPQAQAPLPAPAALPVPVSEQYFSDLQVPPYTPDGMRTKIQGVVQMQSAEALIATTVSDEEFFKGLNLPDPKSPGLQQPVVLKEVSPRYTSEAMRAKVQGAFYFQCVIMPDGTVGRARLRRIAWLSTPTIELDAQGRSVITEFYGLDKQALAAISQWLFRPATVNGEPVPFLTELTLSFRIF